MSDAPGVIPQPTPSRPIKRAITGMGNKRAGCRRGSIVRVDWLPRAGRGHVLNDGEVTTSQSSSRPRLDYTLVLNVPALAGVGVLVWLARATPGQGSTPAVYSG